VCSIGPITPPLRTVTLCGFSREAMNTTYAERRQRPFLVNDRETYWSADERFFLFWCKGESRWKGCCTSHLAKIQEGRSVSFVGAPLGLDILSASLPKGWHEWQNKEWVLAEKAGVASIGPAPLLLRSVTLSGFKRSQVNVKYEERRSPDFLVNHRETYCSLDGKHFLYWCIKESRWKGSNISHLRKIQAGASSSYLGAPLNADILSPALVKGWHEWRRKEWIFGARAGIGAIGCSEEPTQEEEAPTVRVPAAEAEDESGTEPPTPPLNGEDPYSVLSE